MTGDCTRVYRVCGVEVNQGGVTWRGRGAAAYRHQMQEETPEWVNILRHSTVTPRLGLVNGLNTGLIIRELSSVLLRTVKRQGVTALPGDLAQS